MTKTTSALMFKLTLALSFVLTSCTGSESRGKKNEIHINIVGEPASLNPITATDGYAQSTNGYILDSLLTRDPDTYDFKPNAAESYTISPDGLVFTFKLRAGMKFHNGDPVTAEDVKTAFDAIFDNEYNAIQSRPYFSLIDKCVVVDPLTVKFIAKQKYFLNFETVAGLTPLPSKIYKNAKEGKKLNLTVIGSGPYKLEKFERGKRIVLTKNQDYWAFKAGNPKKENNFDKVVLYFVDDPTVELESFKKGKFDMLDNVRPEVFEVKMTGDKWGKELIKVKADNEAPKGYNYVGWNLRRPLFQSKKLRKALALLMNKPMMLEKFFYGMYDSANGPESTTSDYNDKSVAPTPFDPEKAKALLKEEGWKDSDKDGILDKMVGGKKVKLSFTILIASEAWQRWLTIYKEDAKKIGVDVNIQLLEWNSFLKNLDESNFDAVAMAWGGGGVEKDFKQIWHSESAQKGGSNHVGYMNKEVDSLIDTARGTLDRKNRIEISHKIFRIIADDAPYIFMFSRHFDLYAHNSRILKPKDTFKYSVGSSYWKVAE
jgi:peptide/nickel transport system substrate-binding protein/microcin C transport system substrate-binding protein